MADIFHEVEEGLRHDRHLKLFRKYGPLGGALIASVILGVAGREAYNAYRDHRAAQSSDAFVAAETALEMNDLETATSDFAALARSGSGAYPAFAKMQQAAAVLASPLGSRDDAARLFDEAADLTRDPILHDMALLKAAYLLADTLDVAALEARLTPLMEHGAPYELAARELLGAAALQAGDYDRAREAYTYLTVSLEAPGGVQRRAQQALAVIDAVEAGSGTGSEAGAGADEDAASGSGSDSGEEG